MTGILLKKSSILNLVNIVLFLIVFLPNQSYATRIIDYNRRCQHNQRVINSAIEMYYMDHENQTIPPNFMDILIKENYLKDIPYCSAKLERYTIIRDKTNNEVVACCPRHGTLNNFNNIPGDTTYASRTVYPSIPAQIFWKIIMPFFPYIVVILVIIKFISSFKSRDKE